MQLTHEDHGTFLLITLSGRLDATWADTFAEAVLQQIRQGRHQLVLDVAGLVFISSAGIRSLLLVYKELSGVNGHFHLVHAGEFVRATLTTSGFAEWLSDAAPQDIYAASEVSVALSEQGAQATYLLSDTAGWRVTRVQAWQPWQVVRRQDIQRLAFTATDFGLGIGCAASGPDSASHLRWGEFVAVSGNVACQPPDEHHRPDYLIHQGDFIPEMECIQALRCSGDPTCLFRFASPEDQPGITLSALVDQALTLCGGQVTGFVILGENAGLVGATLIQSPGRITATETIRYPGLREWLSFCGERVYPGEQALIAGLAARPECWQGGALAPLPSRPDLTLHAHATVFPYQPLPNGRLDLAAMVRKFFDGPAPRSVLHLVDDARPGVGLGESRLLRGACWCGPVRNPEVLA